MQHLKTLVIKEEFSLYEIKGDYSGHIKRYIVSTPETRDVCNKPEVLGCRYTNNMMEAVKKTLQHLPIKNEIIRENESDVCVVNFLRGGLNFGIREALCKAYNFNTHSSSFMTSQRFKTEDDRWYVKEDQYRKFKIPKGATILIGDVVATGVTLDNGMAILHENVKKSNSSIKNIIFFTIGCHKTEKILDKYDEMFRQEFEDYKGMHIVYFEGKFKLVDSKTKLRIQIQGTDLLRHPALVAPEFELSQYDDFPFVLERCTIYDAGSRSFDIPCYVEDVEEYWGMVLKLAKSGWTFYDALKERWPETEYSSYDVFVKAKKEVWQDIDEKFLKQLYNAYQKRWDKTFLAKSRTSYPLIELCTKRINLMKKVLKKG